MKIKKSFSSDERLRKCSEAFGQRVRYIRVISKLTQAEFMAEIGGFAYTAGSKLERGVVSSVPVDMMTGLSQWAEMRKISLAWLFGGQGSPEAMVQAIKASEDPNEMYDAMFRSFMRNLAARSSGEPEPDTKDFRLGLSPKVAPKDKEQKLLDTHRKESLPSWPEKTFRLPIVSPEQVTSSVDWWKHYVPIVGRVAAGSGLDSVEAGQYPPSWCGEFLAFDGAPRRAIAVRVKGRSMEPEYGDGDIIVVDPDQHVQDGLACVLLSVDGEREPVLKRICRRKAGLFLESTNPEFPAKKIEPAVVSASYKIVAHLPARKK